MYVFTQICSDFEEGVPPSQGVSFPGVQLCLQSPALPPVLRCLPLLRWLYWAVSLEHMPLCKPPLNYSEPKHSKLRKEQEVKLVWAPIHHFNNTTSEGGLHTSKD